MRPLEIVFVAALAIGLIGWIVNAGWSRSRPFAGVLGVLALAHVLIEGPRLPLAIAYRVAVLLVARALRQRSPGETSRSFIRRFGRALVGVVALGLVVAPPSLLPVFKLPVPSGSYGVGGTAFAVVDSSRQEEFGPAGQAGFRTFPVRVWYPAAPGAKGKRVRYAATPEVASPMVKVLPPILVHQYRYVKTHTVAEAPLAPREGLFPVLIFSHGYTGYSAQNTPQMEELASRGYVVLAIAHTYDASAAVFPDGRVIAVDPGLVQTMAPAASNPDSVFAATRSLLAALDRAGTSVDRQARFRDFMQTNPPRITKSYPVWARDTRYLLDYLERLPGSGPTARFAGKLDLSKVGIFGMSFGGSNAGEVCRADPRCRAGINIDGMQFGPLIDDSLTVPFMIVASETAVPLHRAIFDRFRGPGYLLTLKGTQHVGLTDLPYLAPFLFSKLGLTGTMPVDRSEQVMSDYIGGFFDTYLQGRPSTLFTNPEKAEDLDFRSVNR